MNDSTLPPTSADSGRNIAQQRQHRRQAGAAAPARGPVVARNTARNKVALRRGFGLHDWSLLCRSTKDLAQRKGAPLRPIRSEEIAQHASVHDAWISLHGKVYNITPYLHYHPGGVDIFQPCLGGDASELFDKYHRWVNTQGLVGVLQLGYLAESASAKAKKAKEAQQQGNSAGTGRSAAAAAFIAAPSTDADGFAMPAPRPPRGGKVPSLLGKQDGDDDDGDEEEEGLLMS